MITTKFVVAMALVALAATAAVSTTAQAYVVTPTNSDNIAIVIDDNGTAYMKPYTKQYDFQIGPNAVPYSVTLAEQ